ncbi:MAG: aminotransferase class I/II-fold pyridoxal phosphate-dependent enzyme [Bacteroidota bacterium]
MKNDKLKFDSKLVHSGTTDDQYGSAVSPIYQTSTFKFENVEHGAKCFSGEADGYIYSRIGNPTINALESAVALLENGYRGIATSSGMGAISTVYSALLSQGAHLVSHNAVYGPSRGIIENIYSKFGVQASYVDCTDIENIKAAIRPETKFIYIETPANPTMDIMDIAACAELAHAHNIPLVVDNTFCSPYLQRPFDLGADIIVHSMTKFINGHADVVAGMIITRDEKYYTPLRTTMVNLGFNMDPHQAFLVHRGLTTLAIRIERAQQNAIKVAEFLEKHPKVSWVKYPGLKSHPQYELGRKQMSGPGCLISFELKGGLEAGRIMLDNVKLAILAVSLGGVETLIQHPASMTHSKLSQEKRVAAGITDGLVRLSVGIEDCGDLIEDLDQAMKLI